MCKIKTVIFDLDDTILDFRASEAEAIKNTLISFGINPTEEIAARYSEINLAMWKSLERGERTRAEIRTERFKILFSELGISISADDAKRLYERKLSETCFFEKKAKETLEILKNGYSLYLASNGTAAVQEGRIKISGISKYFKKIFISELIGHNKPSREFFDYCFMRMPDFKRDETIIVGDSLTSDILGGINAGIKTCLYNPESKPRDNSIVPSYEIKSLEELPLLIEGI